MTLPATRRRDVSRIEGFSDAVFAFALTLLVVSLEVPTSFRQLTATLQGFPAFGLCFALIVWVWQEHYRFFRRFGPEDGGTVALNAVLLFVVLFYVYPLKFLFGAVVWSMTGLGTAVSPPLTAADARLLMMAYGGGFAVVFALLALLHLHALRRAGELELDDAHCFAARAGAARHLTSAAVGLLSIALAWLLPIGAIGMAGWSYFALWPAHALAGRAIHRARRRRGLDLIA